LHNWSNMKNCWKLLSANNKMQRLYTLTVWSSTYEWPLAVNAWQSPAATWHTFLGRVHWRPNETLGDRVPLSEDTTRGDAKLAKLAPGQLLVRRFHYNNDSLMLLHSLLEQFLFGWGWSVAEIPHSYTMLVKAYNSWKVAANIVDSATWKNGMNSLC
jgi:hypothetical protein